MMGTKKTVIFCIWMIYIVVASVGLVISDDTSMGGSDSSKFSLNKIQNKLESLTYVPGEVLVKFKTGISDFSIQALNSQMGSTVLTSFYATYKKDKIVHRIKIKKGLTVEQAIAEYRLDPSIEYVQPNYIYRLFNKTPNDTNFNLLWGLHNTGQTVNGTAGTLDADIDAPEAWDISTGSSTVIVAVTDTGVAINHPDLTNNIWINTGETNCTDGIDNDGNGYVDDCYGWDFFDNDKDITGFGNHGTHVAGTIGAIGDNNVGITGVNWNVKIMPLKIFGVEASATTDKTVLAINYAAVNGARVINASWGGGGGSDALGDILRDAIDAAGDAGVLFIAAAGNGGPDGIGDDNDITPFYPSSYTLDCIISVAATDQNDNLASFSNYGLTSVDVAAPGVNISSTIPTYSYGTPVTLYSTNFDSDTSGGLPTGWSSGGTNNTWAVTSGTGVSGSKSLEDSPGANYLNNTNSWIVYNTKISYTKDSRYKLNLSVKYELESNYDYLDFIYSPNNVDWYYSALVTGTSGGSFSSGFIDITDLIESGGGLYFGFRLYSDVVYTYDGVYIDNLSVTREPMSIASYDYTYMQGTSMAAPHVAGLAGLLLSVNPDLTVAELKALILDNVDQKSELIGKMVTGGRINAYNSLSQCFPSLTATTASSSEINLSWTDNVSNELGFKIERKTGASGTYSEIAMVGENVTTYSDTGLNEATTYYYRVRAYNLAGDTPYSNEAGATTLPLAPSGLTVSAISSSQINLSWTDNSSGETDFKIERKTGASGTYSQIGTVSASVTTYSDVTLGELTTYYYRVRAYNTGGNSSYSNETNATTLLAAPTNLSATAVSTTQINLLWTDNSSGETGFKIERAIDGVSYSEIVTLGANVTSYSDTGLIEATTYYYKVSAYNATENSTSSNVVSTTTIPNAPSSLSATSVSDNEVDLTWQDNSGGEAGYKIERKEGSTGTYSQIATVSSNVTSYSDTSGDESTTYYYRVCAYTSGYSSYTSEVSALTFPAAPSGLSVTSPADGQIKLTWQDNSSGETGFKIERKSGDTGTYTQIGTASSNATTYTDTYSGEANNYYRVRAYNSSGSSDYSEEANFLTLPEFPFYLTAEASGNGVNLTWTDRSIAETGFIIERREAPYSLHSYTVIATVDANTTSYTDTGLPAGETYYYRVRAYNTLGYSEYSEEVAVTTSSGGGGGVGGCFIATAAYGSMDIEEVKTLVEFRDEYLMNHLMGRGFVKVYYRYSPALAEVISNNQSLKHTVKLLLEPLVILCTKGK